MSPRCPPSCRSGMGTSGGTLGRAKALPKLQARAGALARSLPGPSLLLPAPPIPWAPCPSGGDPTPRSCLTAGKGFETTGMARGETCWAGGAPNGGFRAVPDLHGRSKAQGEHPGNGEDLGLIAVIYPQIPALEGLWGARAGGGRQAVTLGGEGTPGRTELVLGIPELGKAGGRRGRGRCELAACSSRSST